MKKRSCGFSLLFLSIALAPWLAAAQEGWRQNSGMIPSGAPPFEKYAVHSVYMGRNAPVRWRESPLGRRHRTTFLEAAKRLPDFAGRYIVVTWGCGSNCQENALIDARTGKIYPAPRSHAALTYRKNSALLIVDPAMLTLFDPSYFVWKGNQFEPLR